MAEQPPPEERPSKKPDLTPEAILGTGIVLVSAFVDLDPQKQEALQTATTILGPTIVAAGSFNRWQRLRRIDQLKFERRSQAAREAWAKYERQALIGGLLFAVLLGLAGVLLNIFL